MTEPLQNELSPSKQALLKIRELKQQLAEAQQGKGGPIAVVSMACRFPRRSQTPEQFWQCLLEKTDEVGDIPEDRWDLDAFFDEDPEVPGKMYARKGVFLDNLDLMDPEFFGISPREATWVDPQQRLLMEVGWEALERAGWQAESIGEHTGIFVGWMHNDYQNEASDSFLNLNPYIATGAAGSFLCGRLAYYLGLQGPSVAVDTACSSSLVALHLACQSLQRYDCDRALVGGVNAIVSPTTNILTCKLKALSPNGHSRAFDAAADGYLRGEGCGVVTLRRLEDAQRDGDPIIGIIRGSAVGHNGFSSGLTAPNPKAQEKVIRQALERAGISPAEVAYLEAHGTGTELGDPIELQAAAAALSPGRASDHPLLVGSVKTNIGHLEAAAGMAGLIKVLLAIEHEQIPAQLNFDEPNPHIPWDKIPVEVVTSATAWPTNGERRIAGVSAFGMSGTNAHVVIEAPQKSRPQPTDESLTESPHLIVLSGNSEEAIPELAGRYAKHLQEHPSLSVADVSCTTCTGRSHLEHRAAFVASSRDEAIQALNALERTGKQKGLFQGNSRRAPRVAWQFTGQGSQYVGMAQGLYQSQIVFQEALHHCDILLNEWRGVSLLDVMFEQQDLLNHTSWTQPAIFAVQMGLAKLLESWGLQPDAVMGHSVGQYAAACVAGIMSWDDGLHLISERGRLIGNLPPGGRMLAVFAPLAEVDKLIASSPDLSLAALNGTHIVVSGTVEAVDAAEQQCAEQGIRTKGLTTSHAFHSKLMDPALEPFRSVADSVRFEPGAIPLVCNVTGKALAADEALDGSYWAKHIREAVRFSEGIETVQELGCEVLLELGPQGVLTRMAAANWRQSPGNLVSCLQHGIADDIALLQSIGRLYTQGATPDFTALFGEENRRQVLLPTYPFQRRRFWGPDKPRAFYAEFHTAHPLLGGEISLAGMGTEKRYESFVEPDSPPWLPDHEVMGQIVMPGAAYVEMACAAASGSQIQDAIFEQPLQPNSRTSLQTVVRTSEEGHKTLEVYSTPADEGTAWTRNFSARLSAADTDQPPSVDRSQLEALCNEVASPDDFYRKMQEIGLAYGPAFQTIDSIRYSETDVLAHLKTGGDVRGFQIPPPLLDGALHALAVGLLREDDGNLFLPVGMERAQVFQAVEGELWSHAHWNDSTGSIRTANLTLFTDRGEVVARIENLRVQQVSRAALRQLSGAGAERLIYDLQWKPYRLPASNVSKTKWLVVSAAESGGLPVAALGEKLNSQGHEVVHVQLKPGAELASTDALVEMCGENAENWPGLFDMLSGDEPYVPDGITWLLGNDEPTFNSELSTETKSNCTSLLHLIATMYDRGLRSIHCGLQLVTTDAISSSSEMVTSAAQSQYWGLGRVMGAELHEFRCRMIDLASSELNSLETAQSVAEILLTETHDSQFLIRGSQLLVPRLKQAQGKKGSEGIGTNPEASYLITGGLGMLGRQAAKWLAENGATQVVLVSRREPNSQTQEFLDSISAGGCQVVVHSADMSCPEDVGQLFQRFGNELLPLAGVIHAAGVLDDALLENQNWQRFEKVLGPKVIGANLLHECTKSLELDFFILYSSVASVLGSPGQSNYATANAYLDGLAAYRRSLGLPAVSINWGPWTEGMADDDRIRKQLALQGITPLSVAEAHEAMEQILASELTQATVLDVEWQRMRMGLGSESPAMLSELTSAQKKSARGDSELVSKLKKLRGPAQKELLVKTIQNMLQGILSTPEEPELNRPLIEMGLDSLMAVEFGTELQQLLGDGFAVNPTMLFDHPTIDAISDHVLELITAESEDATAKTNEPAQPTVELKQSVREDVAIIGMSCRFPGAQNVDEFWQNLIDGIDSVGDIPDDRWDIDRFYDADREPGKMYTRQGGFLEDIGDFDASFFNISEQEACWIDPQHRMLLENSYRALEDAGIATQPLADTNVGVFMGIMGQDYAFLPTLDDTEVIKAFQGAGLSHSAGVGRISYMFGFEGPSIAVDTASSSSLVALLQAVRSLQDGNCNMALAGGVNAILAPVNSLLMSKAALLSPDGRCKSFSAEADGFGRGEGCGVVVLKRWSDAQRDGDRIMAVVRGGAIVHNGFTGGITSPSSKSQARVIHEALADARIAPSQVQYLEAHGTGTEFGDPMELGAAASVYGKGRQQDNPLLVGTVKANISHLEAAGGISGLIKTVLCLHHGLIPPQIHFEEPSPHIPWNRLPVKVVTEQTTWPEGETRIAGVTALGLVGTNAHVILSSDIGPLEDTEEDNHDETRPAELMVMSARNPASLCALASSYHNYLTSDSKTDFASICHTLAVGRRHYEYRVAFTAKTAVEAAQHLASITVEQESNTREHLNGKATTNGHALPPQPDSPPIKPTSTPPKLAWFFGGEESAHLEVARELYEAETIFRELMASFDDRLAQGDSESDSPAWRLTDWLEGPDEMEIPTAVRLYAIQAGMAKLWQAWGLEPDSVLGHGVGQYTATCIAGGLCFLDALVLVVQREQIIKQLNDAGLNSTSITDESQLPESIKQALDQFEAMADQFNYYPPNLPLVCSLRGEIVPVHRSLGGSYWRRHCLEQPAPNESMQVLLDQGCDFVLEVSPVGESAWDEFAQNSPQMPICLKSLTALEHASTAMLNTLGQLYTAGANPNFKAVRGAGTHRRVSLPTYPFQKQRYWITEISDYVDRDQETAHT